MHHFMLLADGRVPTGGAYAAFLTIFCVVAIVAQIRSIRKG